MSSNADDGSTALLALGGTLLPLAVISTLARFIARHNQKEKLWVDDWCITVACLAFIGACGCLFWSTDGHLLGYTKSSVDPTYLADTKEAFSKMQIVVDVLCIACYGFVKLSALAFFYRIFIREIFQYICIALAVIVGLWMIAFSFLAGFQCGSHFSALWIAADYAKYCVYSRPFLLSLTISDPILDFFVLALPIVPVIQLHAKPAKKLAIGGVFMLGLGALAASLTRLVVYVKSIQDSSTHIVNSTAAKGQLDPELIASKIFFYYILEGGLSIIATNLPTTWALALGGGMSYIVKFARSVTSIASRGSRGSAGSNRRGSGATGMVSKDVEEGESYEMGSVRDKY